MIITKTPFRISFAGGGSDLADFYEQYGGCVLSTSAIVTSLSILILTSDIPC